MVWEVLAKKCPPFFPDYLASGNVTKCKYNNRFFVRCVPTVNDAIITFKQAGSHILLSLDNKITIGKWFRKDVRREISHLVVCHLRVNINGFDTSILEKDAKTGRAIFMNSVI